jgi:hypothetical protein
MPRDIEAIVEANVIETNALDLFSYCSRNIAGVYNIVTEAERTAVTKSIEYELDPRYKLEKGEEITRVIVTNNKELTATRTVAVLITTSRWPFSLEAR